MLMPNRSSVSSSDARFKFTGKERDSESGWDYFGKRNYDSFIGRFPQVDPLAVLYPGISTYAYCLNNPVNVLDPKGSYTYTINGLDVNPALFDQGNLMQNFPGEKKEKEKEEKKGDNKELNKSQTSNAESKNPKASEAKSRDQKDSKNQETSEGNKTNSNLPVHSSGTWKENIQLKLRLGQSVEIEVKNINILGTTISIQSSFPYDSEQKMILLPQQSHTFKYDIFGNEPISWIFNVSTVSDAFIVNYIIRSSWVPGMPPNPIENPINKGNNNE